MKTKIIGLLVFVLIFVLVFIATISFTQETNKKESMGEKKLLSPKGNEITVLPYNESLSKIVDRSKLKKEAMNKLGKYVKTLLVIDDNTKIDWYILDAPTKDRDMVFSDKTKYPSNISQVVFDKDGKKYIVWADLDVLPNKEGTLNGVPNMNIVPVYDVIYNHELNQVKILYSVGFSLYASVSDLDSKKIVNYISLYTIRWFPTVPNSGEMKTSEFINPNIVKVTNTIDGIFHIRLLDKISEGKVRNFDLLWWNEKGNDFTAGGYYKAENYYVGGSEPTYDESEWKDWYQMGYDYSSGKKVKLNN